MTNWLNTTGIAESSEARLLVNNDGINFVILLGELQEDELATTTTEKLRNFGFDFHQTDSGAYYKTTIEQSEIAGFANTLAEMDEVTLAETNNLVIVENDISQRLQEITEKRQALASQQQEIVLENSPIPEIEQTGENNDIRSNVGEGDRGSLGNNTGDGPGRLRREDESAEGATGTDTADNTSDEQRDAPVGTEEQGRTSEREESARGDRGNRIEPTGPAGLPDTEQTNLDSDNELSEDGGEHGLPNDGGDTGPLNVGPGVSPTDEGETNRAGTGSPEQRHHSDDNAGNISDDTTHDIENERGDSGGDTGDGTRDTRGTAIPDDAEHSEQSADSDAGAPAGPATDADSGRDSEDNGITDREGADVPVVEEEPEQTAEPTVFEPWQRVIDEEPMEWDETTQETYKDTFVKIATTPLENLDLNDEELRIIADPRFTQIRRYDNPLAREMMDAIELDSPREKAIIRNTQPPMKPAAIKAIWKSLETKLEADKQIHASGQIEKLKLHIPGIGAGQILDLSPPGIEDYYDFHVCDINPVVTKAISYRFPSVHVTTGSYDDIPHAKGLYDIAIVDTPHQGMPLQDADGSNLTPENFFVKRAAESLKPGGQLLAVTSHNFLNQEITTTLHDLESISALNGALRIPGNDIISFTSLEKQAQRENIYDASLFKKIKYVLPDELQEKLQGTEDAERAEQYAEEFGTRKIWPSYFDENWQNVVGLPYPSESRRGVEEIKVASFHRQTREKLYEGRDSEDAILADALASFMNTGLIQYQGTVNLRTSQQAMAEHISEIEELPQIETAFDFLTPGALLLEEDALYKVRSSVAEYKAIKGTESDTTSEQSAGDKKRYYAEKLTSRQNNTISDYFELRNAAFDVLNSQVNGLSNREKTVAREHLNWVYEQIKEKHDNELLRDIFKSPTLTQDSMYFYVKSLEKVTNAEEQVFVEKASLFNQDIYASQSAELPTTENPHDALAISMNRFGRVDMQAITKIMECSPDEAREKLLSSQAIFIDPESWINEQEEILVNKWDYLRGDVKSKLEIAKQAAEFEQMFESNVQMLETVQPKAVNIEDIGISLGQNWLDPKIMEQYFNSLMDSDNENYLIYVAGKWEKSSNSRIFNARWNRKVISPEMSDGKLFLKALNVETYRFPEARKGFTSNWKDTEEKVNSSIANIRDRFVDWVFNNSESENILSQIQQNYNSNINRMNNSLVEMSDEYFNIPGLNANFEPRPKQKQVLQEAPFRKNFGLFHETGTGKTAVMTMLAMQNIHQGNVNKSFIVTTKNVQQQFADEAQHLFPTANIYVTPKYSKATINKVLADISLNKYDMVIMTHEMFNNIPIPYSIEKDYYQNLIRDKESEYQKLNAMPADADIKNSMKSLKKDMYSLQNQQRTVLENHKKKLEDGGHPIYNIETITQGQPIALIIDEAHLYRNIGTQGNLGNGNIKHLTQSTSARGTHFTIIAKHLMKERQDESGNTIKASRVICGTGTPTPNAPSIEMFNWAYLFNEKELRQLNLDTANKFITAFTHLKSETTVKTDGDFYQVYRPYACNIPEMLNIINADFSTAKQQEIKTPDPVIRTVVIPDDKKWQTVYKNLRALRKQKVHPFKLQSLLSKHLVSDKLVDEDNLDFANNKVNHSVRNILDIYHNPPNPEDPTPVQLVILSLGSSKGKLFNVQGEIKDKLVNQGVLPEQIALVNDFKKKEELLNRGMKEAEFRVVIGGPSTFTGIDAPQHIAAIHYLEQNYIPTTQVTARGIRVGNLNPEVQIFNYVVENSPERGILDIRRYKEDQQEQLFTGTVRNEDAVSVGTASLEAALQATTSGVFEEYNKVKRELAALRATVEANAARVQSATSDLNIKKNQLTSSDVDIRVADKLLETINTYQAVKSERKAEAQTAKDRYNALAETGKALIETLKEKKHNNAPETEIRALTADIDANKVEKNRALLSIPKVSNNDYQLNGVPVEDNKVRSAITRGSDTGASLTYQGIPLRLMSNGLWDMPNMALESNYTESLGVENAKKSTYFQSTNPQTFVQKINSLSNNGTTKLHSVRENLKAEVETLENALQQIREAGSENHQDKIDELMNRLPVLETALKEEIKQIEQQDREIPYLNVKELSDAIRAGDNRYNLAVYDAEIIEGQWQQIENTDAIEQTSALGPTQG